MKTIVISGIIGWDVYADSIRRKLNEAGGEDLDIQISSPGGFVYDGLEIYNLLRNYQGKKTTQLMGLAASMASYIAMVGDTVKAHDNAVFMIHNPWNIIVGDHQDFRKEADILERMASMLAQEYAKKSGKSLDEIINLMNEETYLFGNEIKEAGFVDEIIETDKKDDKQAALVTAKAKVKNCFSVINEFVEEDSITKAAALIPISGIKTPSLTVTKPAAMAENREEVKRMELDELKKEHPGVYAEAVNIGREDGVKAERERRNALQAQANADPDNEVLREVVADAIANGTDAKDLELQTKISVAIRDGNKLDGENAADVKTASAGENDNAELTEDEQAEVEASVERIKKAGG